MTVTITVAAHDSLGAAATASVVATQAAAGAFSDADKPTAANRPTVSGNTLTWVGPLGGGANNGSPVQQTRVLTTSGSVDTPANGSIVEGKLITGSIWIQGSNITIRQCVIYNTTDLITIFTGSSNIIIEDCLFYGAGLGQASGSRAMPIYDTGNLTVRRCHSHNSGQHILEFVNGGPLAGAVHTFSDNYFHDVQDSSPNLSHYDVSYYGGGMGGKIVYEHNYFVENLYNQTSTIFIESYFGAIGTFTIDSNWLSGGGGTLYIRNTNHGNPDPTKVFVTNNKMGNYQQGFVASIDGTVTHSGNVDINTGASIDSQI